MILILGSERILEDITSIVAQVLHEIIKNVVCLLLKAIEVEKCVVINKGPGHSCLVGRVHGMMLK